MPDPTPTEYPYLFYHGRWYSCVGNVGVAAPVCGTCVSASGARGKSSGGKVGLGVTEGSTVGSLGSLTAAAGGCGGEHSSAPVASDRWFHGQRTDGATTHTQQHEQTDYTHLTGYHGDLQAEVLATLPLGDRCTVTPRQVSMEEKIGTEGNSQGHDEDHTTGDPNEDRCAFLQVNSSTIRRFAS